MRALYFKYDKQICKHKNALKTLWHMIVMKITIYYFFFYSRTITSKSIQKYKLLTFYIEYFRDHVNANFPKCHFFSRHCDSFGMTLFPHSDDLEMKMQYCKETKNTHATHLPRSCTDSLYFIKSEFYIFLNVLKSIWWKIYFYIYAYMET